jgi:histidinol-phosphate aminotransferase
MSLGRVALDWCDLAVPGVRDLSPYVPGKPIAELQREFGVSDVIKLASNENPLGVSPLAKAALLKGVDELALYPDGSGHGLRHALAQHHDVDPRCITLGNGSNDLLVFLAQAFLNAEVRASYSEYAFAIYSIVVQMTGAQADVAPAHGDDHPMALGHDLRALYSSIGPDTRMVFIANPNNPTGTWVDGQRLEDFVASLPPHVICVIDEAYFEYAGDRGLGDASRWLDRHRHLVVLRTFSKAYGLAGLRVGYALSDPGIADLLNRVRPAFNVNSLGLLAAEAALADQAFIAESKAVNDAGLAQLTSGLQALGLTVLPSAANFVLARLGQDAQAVNQQLMQHGVIVRPMAGYGLPDALRISVGTAADNERLLSTLGRVLA